MPRAQRRIPSTRLLRFLIRVALTAASIAASVTHAHAEGHDPCLRLPVSAGVRPGDLVTFHWERSDTSISELEILLSLDGGRRYTECVSPRLDPRTGEYLWRVPNLGVARMRFRIRFNRGGREIEGEPSAMLCVLVHPSDPIDFPAPPPAAEAETAGGSREGGSGNAASPARTGPSLDGEDRDPLAGSERLARARDERFLVSVAAAPSSPGRIPNGDSTPLFIPPRK